MGYSSIMIGLLKSPLRGMIGRELAQNGIGKD